jgi:hypothetical protein
MIWLAIIALAFGWCGTPDHTHTADEIKVEQTETVGE